VILRWPLAPEFRRITQVFGAWPERYGQFGLKGHPGIDFGVNIGTPVLAANDGELRVMWGPQLGWQAWVVADWGETFYAHLERTTTPRAVRAGEVIGYSGNTGTETTGPHLHWEAHPFPRDMTNGYGGAVDPMPLLQKGEHIMENARAEATAVRFEIEQIVRLREEAKQHRDQAASEEGMAQRCEGQANMREAALVNTKNGRAYRVEGILGGALPKGWEG
jgi:hypothetical protein